MKAKIKVRSLYWEIVEQREVSVTSYVLGEGGRFFLKGMMSEKTELTVTSIRPASVRICLEGTSLVLLAKSISPAQGRPCPAFSLNVGATKMVATPTCDAGMIWEITLEGME